MTRKIPAALALLLVLSSAAEARRFVREAPRAEPSELVHGFGDSTDFRLVLQPIAGDVHRMGGARGRLHDFADYTQAGTLEVARTLALGPLTTGPALVQPGRYAVSLNVSGPEGLPVMRLASDSGLRLRLPLVAAPRPPERPTSLHVVALTPMEEASVSLPLAVHLPTASGLLMVGVVETPEEATTGRRRSRAEVIHDELQRRALESGHVRSLERRKSRD